MTEIANQSRNVSGFSRLELVQTEISRFPPLCNPVRRSVSSSVKWMKSDMKRNWWCEANRRLVDAEMLWVMVIFALFNSETVGRHVGFYNGRWCASRNCWYFLEFPGTHQAHRQGGRQRRWWNFPGRVCWCVDTSTSRTWGSPQSSGKFNGQLSVVNLICGFFVCFIWSHTWTKDDFDEEMDEDVFSRKQVDREAECLKVHIIGVSESKGDTRLVLVTFSADIPHMHTIWQKKLL